MLPALVVALVLVPIAELWLILRVAGELGLVPTLLLLVGVSVAGAALLKQQGLATWRRLRSTVAAGRVPASEVTDGALILMGGALLLTPGFLTDAIGLMLLVPATRAALGGAAARLLGRWARGRLAGSSNSRRPRP